MHETLVFTPMQADAAPSAAGAGPPGASPDEQAAAKRAAAAVEELARYRVRSEALLRQRDAEVAELREQLLALRTQRIDEAGADALPPAVLAPAPAPPQPPAGEDAAATAATVEVLTAKVATLRTQVQKLSKWRAAAKAREAALKQEREQMSRALEMLAEEVTTWETRWQDALATGVIGSGPTPAEKVAEKFASGASSGSLSNKPPAATAVATSAAPAGGKKGSGSMSSPPGPRAATGGAAAATATSPPTFLLASVAAEAVSSLSRLLPAASEAADKGAEAGAEEERGTAVEASSASAGNSSRAGAGGSSAQALIRNVLARAGSALGGPTGSSALSRLGLGGGGEDEEEDGAGSGSDGGGTASASRSHASASNSAAAVSQRARDEAAHEHLVSALRAAELDKSRLVEEYSLYRRRVADTTRDKEEAIAALQDELSSMRAKLRALKLASGLSSSTATVGGRGGADAPPLLDAARWAYLRDLLIKYLNAEAAIRGQLEPAIAVVIGYKPPRKAGSSSAGAAGLGSGGAGAASTTAAAVMATASESLSSLLSAVGSGIFGISSAAPPPRHPDPSTLVAVPWSAANGGGGGTSAPASVTWAPQPLPAPQAVSTVDSSSGGSGVLASLSSWWGGASGR